MAFNGFWRRNASSGYLVRVPMRPFAFTRSRLRLLLGSTSARRSRRLSLAQTRHPEDGVAAFLEFAKAAERPSPERPIFILSAGGRSGSTLLQRLVSSGERVLIWGEAYDRSGIVQHLSRSLASFSDTWPPREYMQPPDDLQDISQSWVANLYPPPEALLAAYRELLLELFARPAYALGASRWGFKEVRLGRAEAALLKGLFPDASFLFIRRPLEDAYLSYRTFSGGMDWYGNWPGETAFTPYAFARHWTRLTRELETAAAETGGMLIDYDDLVSGTLSLEDVSAYTGVRIDASVLRKRVGSGARREGASLDLW